MMAIRGSPSCHRAPTLDRLPSAPDPTDLAGRRRPDALFLKTVGHARRWATVTLLSIRVTTTSTGLAYEQACVRLLLILDEAQVLASPAHADLAHSLRAGLDIRRQTLKVTFAGSSESFAAAAARARGQTCLTLLSPVLRSQSGRVTRYQLAMPAQRGALESRRGIGVVARPNPGWRCDV